MRHCAKRRRPVEKPFENTLWSSKLHMANMQVQILVATSSSSSNPVSQSLWGKKGGVKIEWANKMLNKHFSRLKFELQPAAQVVTLLLSHWEAKWEKISDFSSGLIWLHA